MSRILHLPLVYTHITVDGEPETQKAAVGPSPNKSIKFADLLKAKLGRVQLDKLKDTMPLINAKQTPVSSKLDKVIILKKHVTPKPILDHSILLAPKVISKAAEKSSSSRYIPKSSEMIISQSDVIFRLF